MPVFERTVNFPGVGYEGLEGIMWNQRMYFVGGYSGTSYAGLTVYSPNGQELFTANAHNHATSLTGRAFHKMVIHDNRLFVTGGFDGTNALNDCWSYDGTQWTRIATNIGGGRYAHVMWSYDGRLYISGGTNGSTIYNDVWASYDGTNWRRLLNGYSVLSRDYSAGCVYDNRMFLAGGYNGSAALQDIWSSVDGITWTRHAVPPDFPACCCHTLTAFNRRMVLITGATGVSTRAATGVFNPSQLWYSEDATHWIRGANDLEFSRANHCAFSFTEKQRLIVSSGYDGTNRHSDIWQTRGVEFLDRAWDW